MREARSPDGHTFRVLNEEPTDAGTLASLCLNVASLERAAAFYQDVLGFLEIDKGGGDGGNEFVVLSCGGWAGPGAAGSWRALPWCGGCGGALRWLGSCEWRPPCSFMLHNAAQSSRVCAFLRARAFLRAAAGAGQATLRLTQLPPGVALDRGTGYGHLAFSCPAADLAPLQVRRHNACMPVPAYAGRIMCVRERCWAHGGAPPSAPPPPATTRLGALRRRCSSPPGACSRRW